ncbi:hypothetical protein MTR67_040036 [Solanum verrucosum]|uniref:Gag-pol polyprotein n=1 Tax=Solanum verrucosum TaxID=315347 RepID=A0AAF0ZPF3_SOLVR|nr:hypothetical protein MTR67_040036 [Solanum verrucosum]
MICWSKGENPLSMRIKLRMRSKDGKYDFDDLKVVLSVGGIMGSHPCIAQVCFEPMPYVDISYDCGSGDIKFHYRGYVLCKTKELKTCQWKKNSAKDAPIVIWAVFESAFMGRFFPHDVDMMSMMSLFVAGLSRLLSKEGKASMLIGDMDIERLMIYVQQVKEDKLRDREEFKNNRAKTSGNESGQQKGNANQFSLQQKQKGHDPSSVSAPAPRNRGEFQNQNSQNFRARPSHSQGSVAKRGSKHPACAKCGRSHSGVGRDGSTGCFKCGHIMPRILVN